MRVLIFVVTYQAEKHIIRTLERIPFDALSQMSIHTLIVDDASTDRTVALIASFMDEHPQLSITLKQNDKNAGYGGNQKIGYQYAIDQAYDTVVLLHGDGQYAPEYIPSMLQPITDGLADMVLGSRMVDKVSALRGGMPVYKWIGNQILTKIQNTLMDVHLTEWHTGYRAYTIDLLSSIPFQTNSDYFDFDTEIILLCIEQKARIAEIKIPTFYGDEISYVNGVKYAYKILRATWNRSKRL